MGSGKHESPSRKKGEGDSWGDGKIKTQDSPCEEQGVLTEVGVQRALSRGLPNDKSGNNKVNDILALLKGTFTDFLHSSA